jgi:hypothetical protein
MPARQPIGCDRQDIGFGGRKGHQIPGKKTTKPVMTGLSHTSAICRKTRRHGLPGLILLTI